MDTSQLYVRGEENLQVNQQSFVTNLLIVELSSSVYSNQLLINIHIYIYIYVVKLLK